MDVIPWVSCGKEDKGTESIKGRPLKRASKVDH